MEAQALEKRNGTRITSKSPISANHSKSLFKRVKITRSLTSVPIEDVHYSKAASLKGDAIMTKVSPDVVLY